MARKIKVSDDCPYKNALPGYVKRKIKVDIDGHYITLLGSKQKVIRESKGYEWPERWETVEQYPELPPEEKAIKEAKKQKELLEEEKYQSEKAEMYKKLNKPIGSRLCRSDFYKLVYMEEEKK